MKRIAIVPTLCTLGNACCGFASIYFAARVNPEPLADATQYLHFFAISGWLIFAGMVFDMLDGYLARLSKTASDFGAQLDSLCDVVTFGVAPAFLLVRLGAGIENRLVHDALNVIAALYMTCAILRLARFNVQTTTDPMSHRMFRGLPSPAAAGCIAFLAIARFDSFDRWLASDVVVGAIIHWFAPIGALAVALLMVSRVPYMHLLNQLVGKHRLPFSQLVQLVVSAFAVVLLREIGLLLLFWAYALSGPSRVLVSRLTRRHPASAVSKP